MKAVDYNQESTYWILSDMNAKLIITIYHTSNKHVEPVWNLNFTSVYLQGKVHEQLNMKHFLTMHSY